MGDLLAAFGIAFAWLVMFGGALYLANKYRAEREHERGEGHRSDEVGGFGVVDDAGHDDDDYEGGECGCCGVDCCDEPVVLGVGFGGYELRDDEHGEDLCRDACCFGGHAAELSGGGRL